ncbi:MAG: hypothetical protein ACTIDE_11035 [Carnobacterium maltaromaticum]
MGKIEQHMNDTIIYYVEFTSQNQDKEKTIRKHRKLFAFRSFIYEEEVAELVKTYLANIIEITSVSKFLEGSFINNKT